MRFSSATYTATESAPTATITVSRVGGSTGTVTVDYATTGAGTAVPGSDFMSVSGTLSFASGQTSRTFTVPLLDDDVVDGPKTIGLALTNALGAWIGAPNLATLTVTDNDVAGSIQFSAAQYWVDEGGGVVAKLCEPVDGGFAAEPGELALGIAAGGLLDGGDGLVQRGRGRWHSGRRKVASTQVR